MQANLRQLTNEFLNQELTMTLLLTEIVVKTARNGKEYADLHLQDQTQKSEARLWDYELYKDSLARLDLPCVVDCLLHVGEYRDQRQLTLRECHPTKNDAVTIELLVQKSKWNPDKMKEWLRDYHDFIETPHIKELIRRMIFSEPYYHMFCTYPAAKTVHHNFLYGILQHTLEVLKYAKIVAATKKMSQRQTDRLLAMTFLHDWAKIREYEPVPSNGLTLEGRLLGHIFIGAHEAMMVMAEIEGFDKDDALIILNGILGHHGSYEWGSPVLPKTVEAQILHQVDKLSGDIESILSFIENQQDSGSSFTDRLWSMGTDYYKGGLE